MVELLNIFLGLTLFMIGLGIGSSIAKSDILLIRNKKRAFGIGMFCQFGVMPLISFAFAKAFDFDDNVALGMMLTGMAPGGTTSNLFTLWSRGDVALSVSMSFVSTTAAMGMLPLLILIYVEPNFTSDEGSPKIPFVNIIVSLLLIVIPTLIGVYLKETRPELAAKVEKAGSIFGGVFIFTALIVGSIQNKEIFSDNLLRWVAGSFLQIIGCGLGYALAALTKLTRKERRTVSLETGVQNVALVIAMIVLSYNDTKQREDILSIPIIYSICYFVNSTWIVLLFRHLSQPKEMRSPKSLSRMSTVNLAVYTEGNSNRKRTSTNETLDQPELPQDVEDEDVLSEQDRNDEDDDVSDDVFDGGDLTPTSID